MLSFEKNCCKEFQKKNIAEEKFSIFDLVRAFFFSKKKNNNIFFEIGSVLHGYIYPLIYTIHKRKRSVNKQKI